MYHRKPRTEGERENLYGRIRTIAYWLDSFANVGGLHIGLESIVGFIPVIGMSSVLFLLPFAFCLCFFVFFVLLSNSWSQGESMHACTHE